MFLQLRDYETFSFSRCLTSLWERLLFFIGNIVAKPSAYSDSFSKISFANPGLHMINRWSVEGIAESFFPQSVGAGAWLICSTVLLRNIEHTHSSSLSEAIARIFRIKRAADLSMKQQLLPADEWTTKEQDVRYLTPIIEQIQLESQERKMLDEI